MEFLEKYRIGLVLRAFAPEPGLVEWMVGQIIETLNRAKELRVNGLSVFDQINVMIPADDRYPDHDCRRTAPVLSQVVAGGLFTFDVTEVTKGDVYCSVLNKGLWKQAKGGMDYTMILSHGVSSYLTEENMRAMLEALEKGALVTGLALPPFEESVLEGRILNTCAIWHNESLMTAGSFSLRSAQPRKDDRSRNWLRDAPDGGEDDWSYATGVEEMIPLIHLVETHGPCLAPIVPQGLGTWKTPSHEKSSARDRWKIVTKRDRQLRAAHNEWVSLEYVKNGVMDEYRYY